MPDSTASARIVIANRYELLEELGRGGFAIVHRARDLALEREVAIKILRDEVVTETTLRRFTQETQVTAKLEHSSILRVYDTGSWNDRLYYVMEYVRGRTVEQKLAAEGPAAVDDALAVARSIGDALAFAHDRGIVHRDVKPSNILIGPTGALLCDFGIARVLSDNITAAITSTGFAVGTTQYMSPEQLLAEPNIDGRSDQYSLALVCYEMFTGVRPHVASTAEALRALRLSHALVPIRVHRPSVPSQVDDAIRRALAPSPGDRFKHVRDFVAALGEGSNATSPISLRPGVVPDTGAARRRTHLGVMFALPPLVVAALVYLGHGLWASTSGNSSTTKALSAAIVRSKDNRDSVFSNRVNEELELWTEVTARPAITLPESISDFGNAMRNRAKRTAATILLRPTSSHTPDSTRWTLTVFDARVPETYQIVRSGPRSNSVDATVLREMVGAALTGRAADSALGFSGLPERSLRTAESYVKGWRFLRAGAFDSAEATFAAVAQESPRFAQAFWWNAQTAAWRSPRDPSRWRDPAREALSIPGGLHGTDSILVTALASLADDPARACAAYRDATQSAPESFVAWYGLGQCQELDSIVIRDPRIPGAWRFRSSHWSALSAYEKALNRVPTGQMSSLFSGIVPITYASGNYVRSGVALSPDTERFIGFPSSARDSIELIPMLRSQAVGRSAVPESFSKALQLARREFLEMTANWVARAPGSADAWFYRAYALELVGAYDAGAVANSAASSLRRADSLAADDELRARIDAARVRVAVRRGAFDEAKALARLAIVRPPPVLPRVALLRAPLAVFVGDVDATVRLLRTAASPTSAVERRTLPPWAASALPPWLADSLRAFGVRAVLGMCSGLGTRRTALETDFRDHVPPADLSETRNVLLRDVYRAAVPCLGPSILRDFPPENPLDEAMAALDAHDSARARDILSRLDRSRRGVSVSTVTEDALLAEWWIRTEAGDAATATLLLRANMNSLSSISAFTFDEVAQAAALSRIHELVYGR